MRRSFCALLVGALVFSSAAYAAGPHGSIKVGNWKGGAFTNDNTGAFTSCIASANYLSGIHVSVVVSSTFNWSLGFGNDKWRLQQGETFPIQLTFDGQTPFNVSGRVISSNMVFVPMPDNSALIAQFRKSKSMSAYVSGQLFQFKLDATSVLLPSLVNCVRSVNAGGIAAARDFSVATVSKPAATVTPAASSVGSTLKPETNQPQSQEYQLEAIELASNFIIKSSLRNPQVISRSETPVDIVSYGASWKSEEASGFVRIIPASGDVKGLDVAAAIIGNDAKVCKGTFVSGRKSTLIDSEVVFEGVAKCEDSDGARVAQYFILPRKKGCFVLFSVQSNMQTEPARSVTTDEKLAGLRKAALVSVTSR